jgi:hypothetical protein
VALALVLALTAGIGVAGGAIPSGDGTISACHAKLAGVRYLRLIDKGAGESCKSSEKQLSWNQRGPKGDTGPTGPKGDPGPPGPANSAVRVHSFTLDPGEGGRLQANCAAGEVATGGGFEFRFRADVAVSESRPLPETPGSTPAGWEVVFLNGLDRQETVTAYAVCAS